jgi:tRNA threonylcarbamoyladenosine biosynthesis protein TsaB
MYLFLDSSSFIQVGVLDKEYKWLHHEIVPNKKGSQILHSVIHTCLEEQNLKISDIKNVFLANGPGSYTGIRVAEGICQVLELGGASVSTFYHFEVPAFCGVSEYEFFSEAFKGEVFSYKRRGEKSEISLIKEEKFQNRDSSNLEEYSLNGEILEEALDSIYDLFRSKSVEIFQKVAERGERQPPFYYRTVETEFKPSQKI